MVSTLTRRPPAARDDHPDQPDDPPARGRRFPALTVWLTSLVAFFLLGACWAVAAPFGGTYDEESHILRGASTWYGQVRVDPTAAKWHSGGYVEVPASLAPPHQGCMLRSPQPTKRPSAACLGTPSTSHRMVRQASGAARYNPLYYLAVSWPMRLSPDMTGIIWSRLVSALLSALMFASAFTIGWRFRQSWVLPSAVVLIATPTELNLAGSINPNGLEIAAAVLFWTALLVLVRADPLPDRRYLRHLVLLACVAGVPLISMRQMGPLLALTAAVACALAARRGRLRDLLRARPVRWGAGFLTVVAVLGVVWTLTSGVLHTGYVKYTPTPWQTVMQNILVNRSGDWARQVVARFYGAVAPPDWVIYLWYLLAGVAVVAGLLIAGWRLVLACLATLGFAATLAVVLELRYYDASGTTQQGRYYLPIIAGAVLLAASVPAFRRSAAARYSLVVALVTGPLSLLCLALMMSVWQNGYTRGIHPFGGSWLPPGGPWLPLSLGIGGVAVLTGLAVARCWQARRAGPGLPAGV
jgi:hypothetical protein